MVLSGRQHRGAGCAHLAHRARHCHNHSTAAYCLPLLLLPPAACCCSASLQASDASAGSGSAAVAARRSSAAARCAPATRVTSFGWGMISGNSGSPGICSKEQISVWKSSRASLMRWNFEVVHEKAATRPSAPWYMWKKGSTFTPRVLHMALLLSKSTLRNMTSGNCSISFSSCESSMKHAARARQHTAIQCAGRDNRDRPG